MQETCTCGSVRGARGNPRPYRDRRGRLATMVIRRSASFVLSQEFGSYFVPIKFTGHHHQGSLCNLSGTSVRPNHLSDQNFDQNYFFELPRFREGAGCPNQLPDDLLHTTGEYEVPRVRTELQHLLIVPSLAPHPIQTDAESAGHRYFGNTLLPTHGQV